MTPTDSTIIDATGLKCPLPVLRAAKVLRGLEAGTVVTVLADDPMAQIDIPHFCHEAGHALIGEGAAQGVHSFTIRRGGARE